MSLVGPRPLVVDEDTKVEGGEVVEELPLYRVENQQYIHYQKGSLVFYRLREELGEEKLNAALKAFLQAKAFQQPPYTTSLELLGFIRAQATPAQSAVSPATWSSAACTWPCCSSSSARWRRLTAASSIICCLLALASD